MTDKELLELFHSGSGREKAFTILVEKYQQKIYWHIRRMVKTHEDADDVMQNTFIKIWNGLENFRADSQLFTWIYRIATNETITYINYRTKRTTVSFDGNDNSDDEGFSPSSYIKGESHQVDGDNIQARLQKAIDSLPEKQRIVFNLRYYDEMPYEQMSEILDTSVGALKASYHHAAQKIEKFLLGED
ncbi:MAG TPA: sigma-70 family RNA polymerase sigma factor [Chitinophagales bacterium]|nr:sigma-70 family RNA polymerase sigma factor [Chitinophagales bacterium]